MHESQRFNDKDWRNKKRRLRNFLLSGGLVVIIIAIAAPFFRWYVIMHATCGPSDDLCGLGTALVVLSFSLPCLVIGIVMLLFGVISLYQERGR
jgi:hypothetical protein